MRKASALFVPGTDLCHVGIAANDCLPAKGSNDHPPENRPGKSRDAASAESTDKKHAQRSLDRACEVAGRSRRAAGIAELGQQDICRERTQACLHDRKDSEGSAEEPRCQMAEEKKRSPLLPQPLLSQP